MQVKTWVKKLTGFYEQDVVQAPSKRRPKRQRMLMVGVVIVCFAVLAEIFICNSRAWEAKLAGLPALYYPAQQFSSLQDCTLREDGLLEITGENPVFTIDDIYQKVHSVALDVVETPKPFTFQVGVCDDAFAKGERWSSSFTAHGGARRSLNVAIRSNGQMHSLSVSFPGEAAGLFVTGVELNRPVPFHFSWLRFLSGAAGLILLAAAVIYRWDRRLLCLRNNKQQLIYRLCAAVLAAFFCFTFYSGLPADMHKEPHGLAAEYHPGEESFDRYHMMFDSLKNGRLDLNLEPNERLPLVTNPYDPSIREELEIPFPWDIAYYEGKFYSYFGVAPLFLFHLPYYCLTGFLPSAELATLFFGLLFLMGYTLCYPRLFEYLNMKPPFLLWLGGYLAGALACGALWVMRRPLFYEVAALCGIASVVWMLYFSLQTALRKKQKPLFALLTGIAAVMVASSRPNLLLYSLLAALPLLQACFFDRQQPFKKRLITLCCLAVPLAAGAGGLMWYNYTRFGSVLEFGARYQLTVSDISYNRAPGLGGLLTGVYHYLLQPPYLSLDFPYFGLSGYGAGFFGNYYFLNPMVGAVYLPIVLASPWVLLCQKGRKKRGFSDWFGWGLLGLPLLMVILLFSMGGVHFRYTLDFMLFLLLAGILGGCKLYKNTAARLKKPVFWAVAILLLLTCLAGLALSFTGEYNLFLHNRPEWFLNLKYCLEWWR